MVGSVSRRAFPNHFAAAAAWHIAWGAVGGVLAVLGARWVARGLGWTGSDRQSIVVIGVVILYGALGLLVRGLWVPSSPAQVPKDWRHILPRPVWVGLYGLLLGATWTTRIRSSVVVSALLATALGTKALSHIVAFGLSYGAVRTSLVLIRRVDRPTRYGQALSVATMVGVLGTSLVNATHVWP